MPRRERIEISGYHHIYNRGVAKNDIFLSDQDKEKFVEILAKVSKEYKFNIHSFCLMDNHYHLLLENKKENLSNGMRQINSKYANYFNRKYKRVGHLWQDRFKSWYVSSEIYLFTLFKYIETNPIKARMSNKIGEYRYCATYSILKNGIPPFLQNSFILRDYNTQELFEILNIPLNKKEIENLDKLKKIKFKIDENDIVEQKRVDLNVYFKDIDDRSKRNIAILKAFEDNYSKSEIARKLNLSVAGISKIIKKLKV